MTPLQNVKKKLAHLAKIWANVRKNGLHAALAVSVVAAGIMCLVGILTTVEGMMHGVSTYIGEMNADNIVISNDGDLSIIVSTEKEALFEDVTDFLEENFEEDERHKVIRESEARDFLKRYPKEYGLATLIVSTGSNRKRIFPKRERRMSMRQRNTTVAKFVGIDERYDIVTGAKFLHGRPFTWQEVRNGHPVVILSRRVYEELFAPLDPIGRKVMLLSDKPWVLTVVGVFERESDGNVSMPIQVYRRAQPWWPNFFIIIKPIPGREEAALARAKRDMEEVRFRKFRRPIPAHVDTNEEIQEKNKLVLRRVRRAGGVVGGITLFVACMSFFNIMIAYVQRRVNEIGLRKALGATSKEILGQFLLETMLICQLGGGLGILGGLVVGYTVGMFMGLPPFMPWLPVLSGILASNLLGGIAGYLPAREAAQVSPISSLQSV